MSESPRQLFARWRNRREMARKGLVGGRKRHTEENGLLLAVDRSRILGLFMLLLLWVVCTLLLTIPVRNRAEESLTPGERAPRTIFAEFDFLYTDSPKTEEARRKAVAAVPAYYEIDDEDTARIQLRFDRLFAASRERDNAIETGAEFVPEDGSAGKIVAALNPDIVRVLAAVRRNDLRYRDFRQTFDRLLQSGILDGRDKADSAIGQKIRIIDAAGRELTPRLITGTPSVDEAASLLAAAMLTFYPNSPERPELLKALTAVNRELLGNGNLAMNPERTRAAAEAAAAAVEPVRVRLNENQPVVVKNQLVDQTVLDRVRAYNSALEERAHGDAGYRRLFQNMSWSLMLVAFVGFYIYHLHKEIADSNRRIGLVGVVVIASLLIDYGCMEWFYYASAEMGLPVNLAIDAVPVALASVLLAAMLGFRVALFAGLLVSSVCAMILEQSFDCALAGIVCCALAALAVRGANNYRAFFLRTGFTVFLCTWLLDINLMWSRDASQALLLYGGVISLLNGFITAICALVMIFVFEIVFNVSTNMSMMVLCDYSHPLLERLKREAPGTFFHSLMVATLAEDAARAIGANPLRAKVGAMFHDIGKLSKPQYFTENNLEQGNQHIDLNPQVSSIIIRDHVKEGLDMARKYKLARVIRDAIEQHHGNDLVHYFYKRALDENRSSGIPITEAQYRYQGVPPRSREMVIISLADACEAACRSLEKPTASKIEALVDEIFRKRFREHQLVNARVTVEELEKIRNSFVNNLVSMRHGRVSYQKDENNDEGDLFMAGGAIAAAGAEVGKKTD